MLRKLRVVLAVICITLITLLFLDFTGALHGWLGWLAKIQFMPALLALNVGVVLALVVLTLLFGRVYCSVICPLGVFQDTVSWIAGKRKKRRFTYSPAVSWLRYGMLGLFILAFVFGLSAFVALFDPYGAYGRIANNLFAPVYQLGNNLLAGFSESIDSYAFYSVDVWIKSGITFAVAIITVIAVGILAWRNGRTYCNTICPVGTVLGFLSRFSLYRPTIDAEKCTRCNKCVRNCKASCIDTENYRVDYSRCVTCMDCIEQCNFGAMKYVPRIGSSKPQPAKEEIVAEATEDKTNARRGFLSASALVLTASVVKAQQQLQVDGGLADIEDKKDPNRQTPIVPPGAEGAKNMQQKCVACQLCVSVCPNNILRPSSNFSTLMQPEMTFERGYCRPECVKCSEVCPSGAIKPITVADKSAVSIGQAVWIKENCVVNTEGLACTACERHCPTKAITLVPVNPEPEQPAGPPMGFGQRPPVLKYPVVDKELCIGCGACEYLCPARPFSAMYVEGNVRHHTV
ncbi:4Fe-4S dicluster domain-containing protein [Parabacteroides sp. OttesenSCG-928-G07]|nr:4Fe-4S dicluster domain-containing protein [Parabacteroides sp. OttesenSCG-928-G21]MDL2278175.1 4Fe-4S dicluster domain-containing protein [Parabacteroides sp. OttesenSCG-928-G07]